MNDLSINDIQQLENLGITESTLTQQYKLFENGIAPVALISPAGIENGVLRLNKEQFDHFEKYFNDHAVSLEITRFVPASGAASRMFKAFYQFLESGTENQEVKSFASGFQAFAFYDQIKCSNEPDYSCAINNMINTQKLAELPKALIPFHSYATETRTALEEHLVETAMVLNKNEQIDIHFTISESHQGKFDDLIKSTIDKYSEAYGCNYNVSFSYQSHTTDTIAVSDNNELMRNSDGSLMFRPGGHGSLLMNLNNLDADIVFIKNIDNIQPDHLKSNTVFYKKILGGYIISLQKKVKELLVNLDDNEIDLNRVTEKVEKELQIRLPKSLNQLTAKEKKEYLHSRLNRPIRVCGMVKNEGEPGGGPFWLKNNDDEESLQIVESSQIDMHDKQQEEIFKQASYFNPVDLVCLLKDYEGNKFNLHEFTDPKTAFISEKSQDGLTFKVLEHPGLWNGAMADWITVFIEVPISTFSPVKTITDLLRPQHQPG